MANAGDRLILIADDDPDIVEAIKTVLEASGFEVESAPNGQECLRKLRLRKPSLVILDVMMTTETEGFHIAYEIRKDPALRDLPILMLTAKGQVEDRVAGLDAGADDYLVKPFSLDELLARVRALLRRRQREDRSVAQLVFGPTTVDLARQTAARGRLELHLTAKEFAMLRLLAESTGEPVTRERFLDVVWGYAAFPTTRTVDNHIASLRRKLEPDPENPRWLKTVHGVGYKLDL